MVRSCSTLVCVMLLAVPVPRASLPAQTLVRLTTPKATLAEEFTNVTRVREESNGRVIIVDRRDLRIVRADLTRGTIEALGRSGRGPGEYTIPMTVHGWGGDTSLVPDMSGYGQALVITARGVEPRKLAGRGLAADGPLFRTTRFDFDSRGRMFTANSDTNIASSPRRSDSLAIERWDRRSGRRDTIARVSIIIKSPLLVPRAGSGSATAGGAQPKSSRGPYPFASHDQWAVDANGRVAIVTVDPYRVTFHTGAGAPVVGPEIAYRAVPVGRAERDEYRARMNQPTIGLVVTGEGNTSARIVPSRYTEPPAWPRVLPPFPMDALAFAPDGILWIQRAVAGGQPPRFDLVDRAGRVMKQVELPARTRLVGFGARSVYLVRIDADDIERLERHPMP